MNLESLANELFLDIFDFLKAVHLLRAFHDLNARLNNLLVNHFQTHSLDFQFVSKNDFDIVCQKHLPSISNRIRSLCLSDDDDTPHQPELFLLHGLTLHQFIHLRTLSLYHIRSTEIMEDFIFACGHLSHLNNLIIISCYFDKNSEHLFNNIWNLSALVHCHLNFISSNSPHLFPIPTIISSSLKHVSIVDEHYDLLGLTRLLKSTPHLQNFSGSIRDFSDTHRLPSTVPSLTTIKLSFNGSLHVLTNLLQNLPNLYKLTIKTDDVYLNGYQWEELIVNYLPRLEIFQFGMSFRLTQHTTIEQQIDELLNSFRSSFWLDQHQCLPYPFDEFVCFNNMRSKSTCPNNRKYWSYDRVHNLSYNSSLKDYVSQFPIRFSNIRNLEVSFPFDDHFWSIFPTLDRVTTLELLSKFSDTNNKNSSNTQLRDLFDQIPSLNSLTIDYLLLSSLLEIQNTNLSIQQLDLQTNDGHFYGIECISLIHSLFNVSCQVLRINLETRTIVIDLVNTMPNLRSLTFQSLDDTWDGDGSPSTEDELIEWLQQNLPSTCSISRDTSEKSGIRLWIR